MFTKLLLCNLDQLSDLLHTRPQTTTRKSRTFSSQKGTHNQIALRQCLLPPCRRSMGTPAARSVETPSARAFSEAPPEVPADSFTQVTYKSETWSLEGTQLTLPRLDITCLFAHLRAS
ncbi:hypothetical protein QBC32DRAFT_270487 [Pseudoneurospora amorphoporcata]|uniref:Uncharacterized protein n=1 Tax=Pseudoneurospora amorphoporcata TaxID=241081 RepID=A0AAN6NKL6_9PEZI|nr:hypothetical protein QBC32DRAFT_270487 [Pseudoneurospora amorphoporcata]